MSKNKIRVLVVDDSTFFQGLLKKGLDSDPDIEVIASAGDPFEARDLILKHNPDVMTLDVNMPKMNGIDFLRKLMPQKPMKVVVVSSVANIVLDALKAGAIEFVAKPVEPDKEKIIAFMSELKEKVHIAHISKLKGSYVKKAKKVEKVLSDIPVNTTKLMKSIIAIGSSTGGTEAIYEVIKDLPKTVPPIVIVQHMPPLFSKMFADRLDGICEVHVKEAEDGDRLEVGKVLIAPGDKHMKVKSDIKGYYVSCRAGESVCGHCPSATVLFDSVARIYAKNAIGVILTGMGKDGAEGLLEMRKSGSYNLGQDEKTSVVYGMPKEAYIIGAVNEQLKLGRIGERLMEIVHK